MSDWQDTAALGPEALYSALEHLTWLEPLARNIVLDRIEGETLQAIAGRIHVSRERVRQRKQAAFRKLRWRFRFGEKGDVPGTCWAKVRIGDWDENDMTTIRQKARYK